MDDDVDFKLFSELVYISQQTSAGGKSSWTRDGAPDVFMLSVTALRGLEKKYGASSQQVRSLTCMVKSVE